ncbi:TetR family transcriptional regulator [Nocardia alni]|uniref:TetR family transcriptional regulator n=1 Tax=Nocardia alni TaxID=2815723 RepID=UPI001C21DD81|nr:TetR family transcriptional regulator [Nocardia alni]
MIDDSRARILAAALDMFGEHGYNQVSVRELANLVGLTKTAVLYHFPSKRDILLALLEPLLSDSEAAVRAAGAIQDPEARRWAAVEGLLDVLLSHRDLMRIHAQDEALAADETTYTRLRDFALAVQGLIAGPDADLATRVRAAQVYAAVSDPMALFADAPPTQLRAAILAGAARLLDMPWAADPSRPSQPPRPAVSPAPPARGRPGVMTAEMIESARRMRDAGDGSIADIAARLGVSRATLYRHLTTESQ